MSDKSRLFLRRASPLLKVMVFLLIINLLTTGFPWAVFPIAAMSIQLFNIFIRTFVDEDGSEDEMGGSIHDEFRRARRQAREAARDARHQARAAARDARHDARAGAWSAPQQSSAPPQTGSQAAQTSPNAAAAPATAAAKPGVTRAAPANLSAAAHVAQARTYRQAIDNLVKNTPAGPRKTQLADLAAQFAEWQRSVEHMADRITGFQQDKLIQQDLKSVPQSIRKLEAQLNAETDEPMRAQLTRTLEMRRNQLGSLERLQASMRQAEVQLESTVASLGTIYTQALANQSTTTIADHDNLTSDVNEQVRTLQDQLEALEEVRLGQAAINLANHAR